MSGFVMHHLQEGKYILPEKSLSQYKLDFDYVLMHWEGRGFNFPIHSPLYKTDLVKKFRFNEELKASEDWIFHLQVFKHSGNYATIDKPLAVYRKHGDNMTADMTHTVKNLMAANDYIMTNLVEDNLKNVFFAKVNRIWGDYLMELAQDAVRLKNIKSEILNSTTYRLGQRFLWPILKVKKIMSRRLVF
jgi:hypothetical protein